ncbi:hypothetical protein HX109_15455 [Galbibacter sp. BG1]|uniref:hypothetical protein n=1 Tax=Galbibacter sp. BG1 TaxID=1170699 RepID=UPI0015BB3489|nr:hypothetical protein [Galbibacter sp. BG1]QLE02896.1 hypothetical protein HX109_15455 [Galbibacter sp. BG1]
MNVLTHKELTQDDIDLYFYYRQKGIRTGFFQRYFKKLNNTKTNFEAFIETNEEYFTLFGEYRYSCVQSFRNNLKKYLEK